MFFFNAPATTDIYTLSLHDALPILCFLRFQFALVDTVAAGGVQRVEVFAAEPEVGDFAVGRGDDAVDAPRLVRSEEHTSELQSRFDLVCRLLLEKKKNLTPTALRRSYCFHLMHCYVFF